MSYQVLARKWRPGNFSELVGQEHVVAAISNALDNNRLHHAYLFTGTRGVGKTTIARIFSKSLNCEQGMGSNPCGVCPTCKEIENGNYVDLLEIDAASRTKVEDTRELLDNVQYKPTRGEYKVYLIDEVHMLSKHSFNALLKTLEEPPPHVKFLLATTDPQKLPVTILSRCLQFNLKALSRTQISQQLAHILNAENISFEQAALAQLARAAQGSMRDALSLTDQAIAQGDGQITDQVVTDMLGLLDKGKIVKLVHAVLTKDSAAVMEQVETLSYQSPDYAQVLNEIMSLMHQVALTQFVPDACKLETISARAIYELAKTVPAEQVQLMYQVALQGSKDLPFISDGRMGLEMTLLRMLAFNPDGLSLSSEEMAVKSAEVQPHIEQPSQQPVPQSTTEQSNQAPEPEVKSDAEAERESGPEQVSKADNLPESAEPVSRVEQQFTPPEPQVTQAHHDDFDHHMMAQLDQQQDDILAQAEVMRDDRTSDMFGEPSPQPSDTSNDVGAPLESPSAESVEQEPVSRTASLLALKQKLQSSESSTDEESDAPKKSEASPEAPLDNAQPEPEPEPEPEIAQQSDAQIDKLMAAKQQSETIDTPSEFQQMTSAPSVESMAVAHNQDPLAPPWNVPEDDDTSTHVMQNLASAAPDPSIFMETSEPFDSTAHLEEDIDVEVDFDVPVFLDDGSKVVIASQLDTWSQLIEQMNIAALTKQLALHSAYQKVENKVILTLLESKHHLNTEIARNQLKAALSASLQQDIDLEIRLEQPINTPYAVQQSINQARLEHAYHVVDSEPNIVSLKQAFSADVVEGTVKPR